jgi:hypothetical protein
MLRLQSVPLVSYRPYPAVVVRHALAPAPKMGQPMPPVAMGVRVLLDVGISGIISWVGFYTGKNARGLLSILGYGVGIIGGLDALGALFEVVIMGKTPSDPYVQAPAPSAAPAPAPGTTTVPV